MNCINAANQAFRSDNSCTENFNKIMEATSVFSVTVATRDICISQQCKSRLTSFMNYLKACDALDDNDV